MRGLGTTKRGRRLTRLGFAAVLAIALLVGACSAVQTIPDDSERSLLAIDCNPADALIYVDGQSMGVVEGWRGGVVPLTPGKHRVEISREGFYPHKLDIDIAPGRMVRLRLDLIRRPSELERPAGDQRTAAGEEDRLGAPGRSVPLPTVE